MRSVTRRLTMLAAVMLLSTGGALAQQPGEITVFAAASLTNAMQDVADAARAKGGAKAILSFAASSTLAKQIEAGAAADVFVSADEPWMDYLEKRDLLAPGTRKSVLANSLVLVVPADKPVTVAIKAGEPWLGALAAGRIATGDPAHVPVGKYAETALKKLGVWGEVEPRLARADNVRNALVLVERGEAAAGIVYKTDALVSKGVVIAGRFPEDAHEPISYPVALLRGHDNAAARSFLEFLSSAEARAIFAKHGFDVR